MRALTADAARAGPLLTGTVGMQARRLRLHPERYIVQGFSSRVGARISMFSFGPVTEGPRAMKSHLSFAFPLGFGVMVYISWIS